MTDPVTMFSPMPSTRSTHGGVIDQWVHVLLPPPLAAGKQTSEAPTRKWRYWADWLLPASAMVTQRMRAINGGNESAATPPAAQYVCMQPYLMGTRPAGLSPAVSGITSDR
jgi:hypothetical protein